MPVNWRIRETYRNQSFKSPAFHGPITPKKPNTITPRKPKRNLKEAQKKYKMKPKRNLKITPKET
jgi:hypothetical protein